MNPGDESIESFGKRPKLFSCSWSFRFCPHIYVIDPHLHVKFSQSLIEKEKCKRLIIGLLSLRITWQVQNDVTF